nr:exosome component 10 [Onthophagus taurus]
MSSKKSNDTEPMDVTETTRAKIDFDSFSKDGYKMASNGIRNSNALPSGTDFNFYQINESFKKIMTDESNRLLNLMNNILKTYNINDNIKTKSPEEKIELIVEGNDMILERVGDNIDEMNGIKKKNLQPVEVQNVVQHIPINGAWNKTNNKLMNINTNSPAEKANLPVAVHLLTGKNIIRPQTYFKDKIDNSNNYPWQPRITDKPNSIKPLALYLEETEFGESYCHPYEMELDQFQPTPEQLLKQKPIVPKSLEDTPLHEINTVEDLKELVEKLRSYKVIAVDLEHHSYRSFMGITCLMQISTIEDDYLIDTLLLRDELSILNEIFTRPSIVKVFHGADCDVQWLQRDLSLYVVNMFDTHQAAKQLGYSALSLAYLLQRFCKFQPNKHFQLADWRIRPLPDELKTYAREDTHYLIYIYQVLKNELLKQGNKGADNLLLSVIQKSTEVCKKRYYKPILKEDSYLDFYRKCKRMFDNRQLYALKFLYSWRDKLAREEDESLQYILPNHMLLQISELLPKEMQGILACCNPIPPLVKSNLLEMHHIILKAREQPLVKPIMKENTRTSGNVQNHKINTSNPLHCPHDWTYQPDFRDDLPTLLNSKTEFDLEHKNEKLKLEQKLSNHSTFNSNDTPNLDGSKKVSLRILSPYERYKLVRPFVETEEAKKKLKQDEKESLSKKEPT